MSLTKMYSQMQASTSNAVGDTTTSSSVTISYGVCIISLVTNGANGPTIGCDVVLQVSCDGSTWFEADRRTAGTAISGVFYFVFNLGIAGGGGDWVYARMLFQNNTGYAVTVVADAAVTTSF